LLDNPYEAGLGFCVQEAKWNVLRNAIQRRLRTLVIGGEEYLPVYGGEAVLSDGRVVGRLRSCAYGFTVKKNLAYSYLPSELQPVATDGATEAHAAPAPATTAISPKVLQRVAGLGVMVLEFIPAPPLSAKTLQSKRMAARMAQSFHRLHAAPRFLQDFKMFRL